MFRKMLSIVFSFIMITAFLVFSAQAAEIEGDVWDGTISQPSTLVQKDGVYYYEITKCSELAYIAQTGRDWLNYNYTLENNLILNDVIITWDKEGNCTNEEKLLEWTPITGFNGTFLGNEYTVSGMYISSGNNIGLFGIVYKESVIDSINITNSYVSGTQCVGGLAGRTQSNDISNCQMNGLVKGQRSVGGLIGEATESISNLVNYADVYGEYMVAGIVGNSYYSRSISNCINHGNIYASNDGAGGITASNNLADYYSIWNCQNTGNITGGDYVGGIAAVCGSRALGTLYNCGAIIGSNYVGGICGEASSNARITNSYNTGSVSGVKSVGGIAGALESTDVNFCYSTGSVTSSDTAGAIAGSSDHIWGKSTIAHCYYLKDELHNTTLEAFGILKGDVSGVAESSSRAELQTQSTYNNWDFDETWSLSPETNGGYPYLQWQENLLTDIDVTGIILGNSKLTLSIGDYYYLSAIISPINASNQAFKWESNAPEIAAVTTSGKVTAIAPGTATITVTTDDGGYTATCTVTVTERAAEEYRINSIVLHNENGETLTSIPSSTSLATVSVTNLASQGDTLIFLAAYTDGGPYQGLMWASITDLPEGATIQITLPVNNSSGKITKLKAFTIASFNNPIPLGNSVSF